MAEEQEDLEFVGQAMVMQHVLVGGRAEQYRIALENWVNKVWPDFFPPIDDNSIDKGF